MLVWIRSRARRVAATVLVSLVTLGGSALAPHADDCHDHGCFLFQVAHDASAHRFQAATPADHVHALHCVACHWARSLRPRAEAAFVPAPAIEGGARLHVQSYTAARPDIAALPPLRSPPLV